VNTSVSLDVVKDTIDHLISCCHQFRYLRELDELKPHFELAVSMKTIYCSVFQGVNLPDPGESKSKMNRAWTNDETDEPTAPLVDGHSNQTMKVEKI
jgi:hypothetical protein